jgi:hypothetical protein
MQKTHRSNKSTKFTPATYRKFVNSEIEKRAGDGEMCREHILGACRTAYWAVSNQAESYTLDELDALREELMFHLVDGAFSGHPNAVNAAKNWLSQMRAPKTTQDAKPLQAPKPAEKLAPAKSDVAPKPAPVPATAPKAEDAKPVEVTATVEAKPEAKPPLSEKVAARFDRDLAIAEGKDLGRRSSKRGKQHAA